MSSTPAPNHPPTSAPGPAPAPAPAAQAELAPIKSWSYPFALADGKEATDARKYFEALAAMDDGFYPLGSNGVWHGGIHFGAGSAQNLKQADGIRCIADGEVVAYRVDDKYPSVDYADGKKAGYSTGFTLVHHRLQLPPPPGQSATTAAPAPADEVLDFFSLYMHQADWASYSANGAMKRPAFWNKQSSRYTVGERAKDRQAGGLEPSGSAWVSRFPTSSSTADLTPAFRQATDSFISAIRQGGGTVRISATYRPVERAHLMHYAWCIAREGMAPASVPAMDGVDIDWQHLNAAGQADNAAALQGARDMVAGYAIAYKPSLTSRHTERRAIDMTISGVSGHSVQNASGTAVSINALSDLHPVGASYGVHKLVSDPPHWSDDGH